MLKLQPPPLWQLELRVAEIASEQTGISRARIKPSSRLLEDLHIDSLELVELMMALEEEFAIVIPDDIGKEMFVREPVTISVLAEIVRHQWGTGKAARNEWCGGRELQAEVSCVPFTQCGETLSPREWLRGSLYDPIASTPKGCEQFRRATDGMRCIRVPAAEVEIGSLQKDGPPDEKPSHRVSLSEFLIDAEPVSVQAYARFLNSIGKVAQDVLAQWCVLAPDDRRQKHFQVEQHDRAWRPVPGTEHQPMVLVSWFGANAYGLWANRLEWQAYRSEASLVLPTEAQWEYAARGATPQRFPWGNEAVTPERAHVALHRARQIYPGLMPLAPVNALLGMSPFDLHHMAGNVWQWCADWYSPEFYQSPGAAAPDGSNQQSTGIKSERGGSWVSPGELARSSYRRGRPPCARGRCLGFRCVGKLQNGC